MDNYSVTMFFLSYGASIGFNLEEKEPLEQVGMCPSIEHQQGKLVIVLLPNEKPISLDMAFPSIVAFKA